MSGGDRVQAPADILAFEASWLNRTHDGAYERAVREVFGVSVIRHAQVLNRVIDYPAAISLDPVVCRVLRERRDRRMKQRVR